MALHPKELSVLLIHLAMGTSYIIQIREQAELASGAAQPLPGAPSTSGKEIRTSPEWSGSEVVKVSFP
ncbi:MAG: hypothetical protein JWM16_5095 [Verrucomicrobiales bacterium]|nr:hypothetical protein [Verrucomicrobiales bacterium]